MGDISSILPSHFGLQGRAVKERGSYICRTPNGARKIHKTNEHPHNIQKRFALLEQLASAGFDHTDRLFLSRQGTICVNLGRETFVMTRHITGHETDFDSQNDITIALESLAKFHKTARNLDVELPKAPNLLAVWEKEAQDLQQCLKKVDKKLSDFDMLFLKNAPQFIELANEAAKALAKTDYTALQTEAVQGGHICHNDLKEENLIISDEACYIMRITDAAQDLQLADLAGFIRRYARRSNQEIDPNEFLEIYGKINPLPASAPEILYAQLTYPWPFIKLIKQHYSKKRGWTPIATMSRMETILEQQQDFDVYIGKLKNS